MVGQISRSRQHQLVPARKHHWLRWAVAGVAAVVVLALAGTYAFVHFLGGPAPTAGEDDVKEQATPRFANRLPQFGGASIVLRQLAPSPSLRQRSGNLSRA